MPKYFVAVSRWTWTLLELQKSSTVVNALRGSYLLHFKIRPELAQNNFKNVTIRNFVDNFLAKNTKATTSLHHYSPTYKPSTGPGYEEIINYMTFRSIGPHIPIPQVYEYSHHHWLGPTVQYMNQNFRGL